MGNKNPVEAVLFDLDDTLVSTSMLKEYRDAKDHAGLNANLEKSTYYPKAKHVYETLQKMGIKTAIITNSARWYATRVLAFHEINADILICFDDVRSGGIKPSPKGIKIALERLELSPSRNILYIGDTDADAEAAYAAGVRPIYPAWAVRFENSKSPSMIPNSDFLLDSLDDADQLSLVADRAAHEGNYTFEKKQINFLPITNEGKISPLDKDKIQMIALGRYFAQKTLLGSSIHNSHSLSKEIFKKERSESYVFPGYISDLLADFIDKLPNYLSNNFDIVTVIPAKNGKNKRLESLLKNIEKKSNSNLKFLTDIFIFDEGAKSLKTLGDRKSRAEELSTSLHINKKYRGQLSGNKILVIDDVFTTGSTFERAFSLLEQEVCTYSFGIAIAKTVSVGNDDKKCPNCSRPMRVQTNNDGIMFYACTGYRERISPCKLTETIKWKNCPKCDGYLIHRLNKKNGSYFLGCHNYSIKNCSHTERMPEDVV